jgi:GntR family transcriptional regulator / MocR family aminotransferase
MVKQAPKRSAAGSFVAAQIDNGGVRPLYQQLYDSLREDILAGRLAKGLRLPSTRTLAYDLKVSRNTVTAAFDQLLAEGYLESFVGDGTYVSRALPDELLRLNQMQVQQTTKPTQGRSLSERGKLLASTSVTAARFGVPRPFQAGVPAFDAFPFDVWAKLTAKYWKFATPDVLTYHDPAGYRPLRETIATYVSASRGVRCTADQVLVVAGSQQGLDRASRILLDPDDKVWLEDPGYRGARGALIAAGASIIPVPIDADGLDIQEAVQREHSARLAYVTPSHQYPLGVTMSLTRRLALLEWASTNDSWILEDDYDSEYRYSSRPIAALQGLDKENRVIYIGTFSKVLFPGLRLGYLVVPPDLVSAFISARALIDRHPPTIDQVVLNEFIEEGYFERHIRRMRLRYADNQQILIKAATTLLGSQLEVSPADAGMHLIGWLPEDVSDQAVSQAAYEAGINVAPVSAYTVEAQMRGGLLLGYANYSPIQLWEGIKGLAQVFKTI